MDVLQPRQPSKNIENKNIFSKILLDSYAYLTQVGLF